ncbi:PIN domain-containing protein [Acidipila sp. 4G-K13]|nr:PIN domain-containing protein [Paracidobacterium acidisoli]
MGTKVFFDTSVLIYAFAQNDARTAEAEKLLAAGGRISVQVLNEFTAVARRKLGMSWRETAEALEAVRALCEPAEPLTLGIHLAGLQIARRYRVSDLRRSGDRGGSGGRLHDALLGRYAGWPEDRWADDPESVCVSGCAGQRGCAIRRPVSSPDRWRG